MKAIMIAFCMAIALLAHSAPLPVAPTALLVVGNTTLNNGDLAIKNRLQTLGYVVTVKSAASSVTSDATGKNLIFVSATVASADVTTKFTQVTVPLINCENALFDDLEMTGASSSNYGAQNTLTQIKIINTAHPLAAGLSNANIVVYTGFNEIVWGKPANTAIKIATLTGDAQKFPIFGYESGVMMDGLVAPARRLAFFLDDDGASLLTAQGIQLLNAAITWTANVSVQNIPPSLSITAPTNGTTSTPGSNISITATASDSDGSISKVKFFAGSNLLSTDLVSPYSFSWQAVPAGNYTITARAYDNASDSISASVNITVEAPNLAPAAAITSPTAGTIFIAPAGITINASASDDGSIAKVEFYSGNNLLGTDNTANYSFTWTNVAAGNYTLTAKATDNSGKTTTSSAINIIVNDTSHAVTKNVLLVVGNITLNAADLVIKNRLETAGFTVSLKSATTAVTNDAAGKNLLVISSTISSDDLDDRFTNVATPAIVCESGVFPDFKMTGGSGNYGSQGTENEVTITNAAHPLAAGLSGTVAVYTRNDNVSWGKPAAGATIVAMLPGSSSKATIFGYEQGAAMQGLIAPARRVGFFLNENGASLFTTQGRQLLDAAITWTANVSMPPAPNVLPSINITAPSNGTAFTSGADISIAATATDSDGSIARVKFYSGNNLLSTDLSSPYSFLWEDVPGGNYILTARAYDNKNDSASVSVSIVVETPNLAPSASITAPIAATNFIAPAEIIINANAADNDGSIVKVEFYEGSNLLGVDPTSDYSFTWTNVPAGNYTLKVIATDNGGNSTTSSTVNITVEDTTSAPVRNALLLVGNTTLTNSDLAIKRRLESLGFVTTIKSASSSATGDAAGKHVVFISSTVSSDDINSKFTNVATPVILCENGLFDDLKMTGTGTNAGAQGSEKQVTITNAAHSLAGGLANGTISVYSTNDLITWGKPSATAATVAALPGSSPPKAVIFGYEQGAAMQGLNAPARRVGFFLNDNGAALLTIDGWKLFDAAVNWAANTVIITPPTSNAPPAVAISNPSNNAGFTAPATITISANASDTDGTITKVEFYEGNNLIGTDASSPYSFAWNNVSAGNYILKAKATDDDGAGTFSASINVSVTEEPVSPGNPSLGFVVNLTDPKENTFFLENTDIAIKASITATGVQQAPYLKVINNTAASYRKLKVAYDTGPIYGLEHNVIAGGNNKVEITLRDFNGTAQWSKIQLRPNSSTKSPGSLQTYVTAAGGIGNEWKTISIPLADFSGLDFTKIKYIEFPSCNSANQFEIGIQKIVFTGGSAPVVWFGDTKTNNTHDGQGAAGQLLAELITAAPVPLDKVDFYRSNTLLGTDATSPYEFLWQNVPAGNYTLVARGYQSNQFVASIPIHIRVEEAIGDTIKILVRFDHEPSSFIVQKAALKYNKDFAYSYTQDDGSDDGYRIVYKMFSGGLSDLTNINYPGMFYTDGCGNNIPFKAGLAIHSVNGLGQDLHESRSTDNRITWTELKEVHAAGWDVLNHSYSHAANGENTNFTSQVTQNTQYIKSKTGIDATHFVVPSGDERYVTPAFDNGMIAVYDQSGSGFFPSAVQVDAALNLTKFKLKRHFIQNGTDNISNVAEAIDEAASLSVNGKHYWYNDATHNITTDFSGTLQYPVFEYYMNYVNTHYGKNGTNKMWMAPLQEVYEYLAVKQSTVLSSELDGNQLEITLLLHNVPAKLRRYALTLTIDADADIENVSVTGTSNYCFQGTGSNKLINLDWTANYPDKIFKTSAPAEDLQSASTSDAFEMDIAPNPATDVLTVKFNSPEDCNVHVAVFDLLGRNVLNRSEKVGAGNMQFSLNVSKINPGVYFIKAWKADGTVRIERFVKR